MGHRRGRAWRPAAHSDERQTARCDGAEERDDRPRYGDSPGARCCFLSRPDRFGQPTRPTANARNRREAVGVGRDRIRGDIDLCTAAGLSSGADRRVHGRHDCLALVAGNRVSGPGRVAWMCVRGHRRSAAVHDDRLSIRRNFCPGASRKYRHARLVRRGPLRVGLGGYDRGRGLGPGRRIRSGRIRLTHDRRLGLRTGCRLRCRTRECRGRRCGRRRHVRSRRRGRRRRRGRSWREEGERVEIAVRVGCRADPQVEIRHGLLGRPRGTDHAD